MTMAETQHLVLFWVFVAFFLIIGIIAILAIVGVIKTDARFRKWAVGGFAAAIVGVVIMWAKAQPSQSPLDIFVNLEPPADVKADTFELESGIYEYDEQLSSEKSNTRSGSVELTAGQNVGWWTAKIPYNGMTKAFRMTLTDKNGKQWKVRPFYPNYNRQPLIATAPHQNNAATSLPTLGLTSTAFANETKIRFNNYARVTSKLQGRTYYKWRVFVDEPIQELTKILEVQYLLHPTFPYPLQVRTNPNDKFAVDASGWGQFTIQITIKYKDGSSETTSYDLDLTKGWP